MAYLVPKFSAKNVLPSPSAFNHFLLDLIVMAICVRIADEPLTTERVAAATMPPA